MPDELPTNPPPASDSPQPIPPLSPQTPVAAASPSAPVHLGGVTPVSSEVKPVTPASPPQSPVSASPQSPVTPPAPPATPASATAAPPLPTVSPAPPTVEPKEPPPISNLQSPISNEGMSLHALRYSKTIPEPVPTTAPPIPTEDETLTAESFARPPEPGWRVALKAIGIFLTTFVLVFALLQSQALIARARYFLSQPQDATPTQLAQLPKLQDRPVTVTDIKNRPQDYLPSTAQLAGYTLADLSDNQLLIPKISVNAPIIWDPAPDETSMLLALRDGVARYNFTALPTDGRGNIFITGHSSSPLWDPGKYKTVFANLDRLIVGDQLAISYQGIVYIYEVTGSRVVKPDDVSVLDQTDESTLSLMTCVPVGTALNRLVVSAKLISAGSHRPIPVPPPALVDPASIFHYLPF